MSSSSGPNQGIILPEDNRSTSVTGLGSPNNSTSTVVGNTSSAPPGTPKNIYDTIMSNPTLTSSNYTPRAALHRPVEYYSESNHANVNRSRNYNNDYALDKLTRKSLPYFLPWRTSGGGEVPPDFGWLTDSCGGKAAIGVFGGGVMGLLMGVFLGALSDSTPPIQVAGGKNVPQAPLREQVRYTMRATAEKSLYWCRNFAFITGVFQGSECLVEKYRGKHDMWNPVASGCITGAALQAHAGPQAALVGCGGFAAFSIVIDKFMGTYD